MLGADYGATAFVEASPEDGMAVNLLRGGANVTADNTTVYVDSGEMTRVPLSTDLSPMAPPSQPRNSDSDLGQRIVMMITSINFSQFVPLQPMAVVVSVSILMVMALLMCQPMTSVQAVAIGVMCKTSNARTRKGIRSQAIPVTHQGKTPATYHLDNQMIIILPMTRALIRGTVKATARLMVRAMAI